MHLWTKDRTNKYVKIRPHIIYQLAGVNSMSSHHSDHIPRGSEESSGYTKSDLIAQIAVPSTHLSRSAVHDRRPASRVSR